MWNYIQFRSAKMHILKKKRKKGTNERESIFSKRLIALAWSSPFGVWRL